MDQLFDAGGPVRHRPYNSHHADRYVPVSGVCKHPECDQRRAPGCQYCDEHNSRARHVPNPPEQAVCPCGRSFTRLRRYASEGYGGTRAAWDAFCQDCREMTPLTRTRLLAHKVPAAMVTRWLAAGKDLRCAVCDRRLTNQSGETTPNIDHDHRCCHGGEGCEKCVRGVLCPRCNRAVGTVEELLGLELLAPLLAYLGRA